MAPYMDGTPPNDDAVTNSKPAPSGIRVIVVGAGFAGLTAAIECTRKGHSCIVLESYKNANVQLGDIISFGSNSPDRQQPALREFFPSASRK